MCRLPNIAKDRHTDTDGQTDAGQNDSYIIMCLFASKATQRLEYAFTTMLLWKKSRALAWWAHTNSHKIIKSWINCNFIHWRRDWVGAHEINQTASKYLLIPNSLESYLYFYGISSNFDHGITAATDFQTTIRQHIPPVPRAVQPLPTGGRDGFRAGYEPDGIQLWSI